MGKWIRQFHRWMAIAFTIGFLINSAVIFMAKGEQPPTYVYSFVLVPLFLLLPTGLYMLVGPWLKSARKT